MKTERRHELQHNELADWIATKYRKIQPYTGYIVFGVVAAFAVVFFWNMASSSSKKKHSDEWAKIDALDGATPGKPEDVQKTIKAWDVIKAANSVDTPIGAAVRMRIGRKCRDTIEMDNRFYQFSSHQEGVQLLQTAVANFTEVATKAKDLDLRLSAYINLGGTYETLGQVADAKKAYQACADLAQDKAPDYVTLANTAKANVDKKSVQSFYALYTSKLKDLPKSSPIDPGMLDSMPDFPGFNGKGLPDLKGFGPDTP